MSQLSVSTLMRRIDSSSVRSFWRVVEQLPVLDRGPLEPLDVERNGGHGGKDDDGLRGKGNWCQRAKQMGEAESAVCDGVGWDGMG